MRPDSIRKFDLFYLAAIAIGIASSLLNYDALRDASSVQLREGGLETYADTVVFLTLGIGLFINLLLWFLASRMRIGFVKWILLVFVAISVLTRVMGVAGGANVSITDLVNVLLKGIAVWFLFQPDAKEWFAAKDS